MIEVDWSDWWLMSVIAACFLGIGGVTGFRAGAKALPVKQALGKAMKNGVCTVIVGTTLLAIAIAGFQLWELGIWSEREVSEYELLQEHEPFISGHPDGIQFGLRLDYEGYWEELSYQSCGHFWSTCARCAPRSPRELDDVVNEAIAHGAVWAFLTPMWLLFGSAPLLGAATVGHSFGIRRRAFLPEE